MLDSLVYSPNKKILYVDDEANLLSSFKSLMRRSDIELSTLQHSDQITEVLASKGPFALVMSDQKMPGIDGVQVLETVAKIHPTTVRIMVTGYADYNDTLRAINIGGISRYISKPWDDTEIKKIVEESVHHYNLVGENKFLMSQLKFKNNDLTVLLNKTVVETVRLLSDFVGYITPDANSQVMRIRKLSELFLNKLPQLSENEIWELERAIDLFNLGIAVLPAWIKVTLNKNGLGELERFSEAQMHHIMAAGLLEKIPRFENVAKIIRYHKKYFNGEGEPKYEKISGSDIPLGSRILKILIDIDKMSTEGMKGSAIFEFLMAKPQIYDIDIINHFLSTQTNQTSQEIEVKITLNELQSGMTVMEDLTTKAGFNLLKNNSVISETNINILKQWHKKDPVNEPFLVRKTLSDTL